MLFFYVSCASSPWSSVDSGVAAGEVAVALTDILFGLPSAV